MRFRMYDKSDGSEILPFTMLYIPSNTPDGSEPWIVKSATRPTEPGKSGKVMAYPSEGSESDARELYAHIFNIRVVQTEDGW